MDQIASFEKVPYEQFASDSKKFSALLSPECVKGIWEVLPLPRRSTAGSAGYDFVIPFDCVLEPGESALIPTGIRAKIEPGWVLMLYPRSGLGFKYRMQLDNTTGVIDSDYYNADNYGHIMAKITNDSRDEKVLKLTAGDRFMQGIFSPYGITHDDTATNNRTGGFGSTGR